MSELDDRIIEEFLAESLENLDQMDRDLVALESAPETRELLARIFRIVHTIKGTCGFLGYVRLAAVTHAGEHLLALLRDGRLAMSAEIANALLALSDAARAILAKLQATRTEGEGDDAALIAHLAALGAGPAAAAPPGEARASRRGRPSAAPASEPPSPAASATPPAPASEPAPPAIERAAPAPPAPHKAGVPSAGDAVIGLRPEEGEEGRRLFDPFVEAGRLHPEQLALAEKRQRLGDPRRIGEILVDQGLLQPQDVLEALQIREERAAARADASIRVDVQLLDRLTDLVGELVLARNQIVQCVGSGRVDALPDATQRLNLITSELQEGMMKTRMQPVGRLWSRLPRVVRDLAAECGKDVRLAFEGADTELDKAIIEAIRDPLTHLVRNAVDHGIEPPEVRLACGKPAHGTVTLRAYHEGGLVILEIGDDGAGIPLDRIRRHAIHRGLVPPERLARMTDRDWMELIFQPGFSTAERVTSISGRGVGMDVVRTNVEQVGGAIEVRSTALMGTTMRIRIPLTLAIVPALIVADGAERFAIPQANLLELVRVDLDAASAAVDRVHGAPVLRLRDRLLPLVALHALLGTARDESPLANASVRTIAVVQGDGRTFGIEVESVLDAQEIVVKPLRERLRRTHAFAGATILGDGAVALILDVPGLANHAGLSGATDGSRPASAHAAEAPPAEALLAFRVRDDWPAAIPLSALARLEEFPAESIERVGDREVVQYHGRILPLVHVAALLEPSRPAPARAPDARRVPVIVHEAAGRRLGVVVAEILDIVPAAATRAPAAGRAGVVGTAVVRDRVADLLDFDALVGAAHARLAA